jgi:predicted DNA-binding transcriptional regulator AlpA
MRTILRKKVVAERVGVSGVTLLRWEKLGTFPKKVQLGPKSVGWFESDVEAWFKARPRGAPPKARTKKDTQHRVA